MERDKLMQPAGTTIIIESAKLSEDFSHNKLRVDLALKGNRKSTSQINGARPIWMESFFYNSSEIIDDDLLLTLMTETKEVGHATVTITALRKKFNQSKEALADVVHLKNAADKDAGTLNIRVNYIERIDIVGGSMFPNLSLVPGVMPVASSGKNAIDNIKPPKNNFYSCMDDNTVHGFEFYPTKYKNVNEKAK